MGFWGDYLGSFFNSDQNSNYLYIVGVEPSKSSQCPEVAKYRLG